MTSKPENGKMVKIDYSVRYRENEKLDENLGEELTNLKRSAQRVLTEKDDELVLARADANRILKLKEAISKQEGDGALAIVCSHTLSRADRKSSTSSMGRRKVSSGTGSSRRSSMISTVRDSLDDKDEQDEECDVIDYAVPHNGELPDMKKMSLTERRLAMERDQFSAKNLFNVRRKNSSSMYIIDTMSKRPDSSHEGHRTSIAIPTVSKQSTGHPRPMTSPAAYGHRPSRSRSGYVRPGTAATARLVKFADDPDGAENDAFNRTPRRPRSRRELQKLSELKIDPFGEDVPDRRDSWVSSGDRQQDMLHALKAGRLQLQARVTAFLKNMEEFNKKGRKTGLEQILEVT